MIYKITLLKNKKIEYINIDLNENNYLIVKLKLKEELKELINLMKDFKEKKIITNIKKPVLSLKYRHTPIEVYINEIIKAKKLIKKQISGINILFS